MVKFILNLKNIGNTVLAGRAAQYLMTHTEKADAILQYGEPVMTEFYVKRNQSGVSVWEQ